MQAGKKFGMQTMNDALYQHYSAGAITLDVALRHSVDANELLRMAGRPVLHR
jgi:twitching motility protein PilT